MTKREPLATSDAGGGRTVEGLAAPLGGGEETNRWGWARQELVAALSR